MKTQKIEESKNFKPLELEFLPEYLEILERPPSRVARGFAAAIVCLCVAAVIWASFGRIDIIASAPGRLIVNDNSKIIQVPEQGEVSLINVKDGDKVTKGEILVELNPTSAQAQRERLKNQALAAQLEINRIQALLSDNPIENFRAPEGISEERAAEARKYLIADYGNFRARLDVLYNQIEQNIKHQEMSKEIITEITALIENTEERMNRRQDLVDKGYFPKIQHLEMEREKLQQIRELTDAQMSIANLKAEELNLKKQVAQIEAEVTKDLRVRLMDTRNSYDDASKQLVMAQEDARKMTITAPVDGIVQQLAVHTLGAVVQSAQELMVIVPEGSDLEVEVSILNKDIGFIHKDQEVEVKIDSIPYTKYGTIKGKLVNISRDSMNNEQLGLIYPARIRLNAQSVQTEKETILLSAGMSVTAEVKTGNRRVISYVLDPLQEYQSEALKER